MELGYSYPSDKELFQHAQGPGFHPQHYKIQKEMHAINSLTSVGDFEVPQRLYSDSI